MGVRWSWTLLGQQERAIIERWDARRHNDTVLRRLEPFDLAVT
jgi:hypothetical protein